MYCLISDNYLMHHGVKGMKWGIRHDPERKSRRQKANEKYRAKYSKVGSATHTKQWYKKASDKEITKDRYLRDAKIGAVVVGSILAAGFVVSNINAVRVVESQKYTNAKMFELQKIPLKDISNKGTIIPKGTDFKRVIRKYDRAGRNLTKTESERDVTWNTFLKNDTKIYKNFFNVRGKGPTIEYTRKAKTDIVAPSERQRLITFMGLLNSDKDFQKAFAKEIAAPNKLFVDANGVNHYSYTNTRQFYAAFTKNLGAQGSKSAAIYFNKLREKGFNAVTDDYDQNFLGNHPIILINTSKDTVITGKKRVTAMRNFIDLVLTRPLKF